MMFCPENLDNITSRAMHYCISGDATRPCVTKKIKKASNNNKDVKKEMKRLRSEAKQSVDNREMLNIEQIKFLYPDEASGILKLAHNSKIRRIKIKRFFYYDRSEIDTYLRWKKHFDKQQKLF